MKVAIIGGSGEMGQWFARFLVKEGKEVVITGRNERKLSAAGEQLGVSITTDNVAAVKDADAILLSVPIDNFEEVAQQVCPHIHPEQVIMDITSIKVLPVEIMHKYIKRGLVLGMHPMFGPGAEGIVNHTFVMTPTNGAEKSLAQKIGDYLQNRGAKVTVMTPKEHDEMMTVILGLAHFIAIVSADTLLGLNKLKQMKSISGSTYKLLLLLAESVVSQDAEFYASLQMSLPGMTEVEKLFQKSVRIWTDLVENRDRQKFVGRMNALKDRFNRADPDFGKSYEKVYKIVEGL